jgi:hypothetical protein
MDTWQVILILSVVAIVFDSVRSTIAKAKGYTYFKGIML